MQDICNINIVESINPIINFKKMCAADERKEKMKGREKSLPVGQQKHIIVNEKNCNFRSR